MGKKRVNRKNMQCRSSILFNNRTDVINRNSSEVDIECIAHTDRSNEYFNTVNNDKNIVQNNAIIPAEFSIINKEESLQIKLISASLLELFLSSLPHDNVRKELIRNLVAIGLIPKEIFSDRYAPLRNSLGSYIAFSIKHYFSKNGSINIDNRITLNSPNNFEQVTSRYEQDFEEIAQIGAGGFGRVYHSKSRVDQQHYAIKKIPLRSLSGKAFEKIMDECKYHASLQHPNVVRYHNAWIEVSYAEPYPQKQIEGIEVKTFSTSKNECQIAEEHGQSNYSEEDSFIAFQSYSDSKDKVADKQSNKIKNNKNKEDTIEHSFGTSEVEESRSGLWATPQKKLDSSSIKFESETDEDFDDINESDNYNQDSDKELSDESGSSLASNSAKKIAEQLAMDDVDDLMLNNRDEYHVEHNHLALDLINRRKIPVMKTLFIQMELCHSTLEKYMWKRNKIDVKFNEKVIEGLLSAVEFLHKNYVVHRDIKPSNIMMKYYSNDNMTVLLGDFGLAREIKELAVLNETSTVSSSALNIEYSEGKLTLGIGTKIYAAPEQLNSREYTTSADIYSCGIILFELYMIFKTKSERAKYLMDLKANVISDEFKGKWKFLYPIIEEMTKIDANLRPTANILLKNFKSWKSNNEQIMKTNDENLKLKKEVNFWKRKYNDLISRLKEKGLQDILDDIDDVQFY